MVDRRYYIQRFYSRHLMIKTISNDYNNEFLNFFFVYYANLA